MTRPRRDWLRFLADLVAVALAIIAVIYAVQAKSGEVARAHDATLPCAQAKHPTVNVLCIVDAELDARSKARDAKEAALAAKAKAAADAVGAKLRTDFCAVLHDLPATEHTDALRRDLGCLTSTPALIPGPTATVIVPSASPSPVPGPRSTPVATGHPTPSATPSRPVGKPSPPASTPPTPTRCPLCVLVCICPASGP